MLIRFFLLCNTSLLCGATRQCTSVVTLFHLGNHHWQGIAHHLRNFSTGTNSMKNIMLPDVTV